MRDDLILDEVPTPGIFECTYDRHRFDWVANGVLLSVPNILEDLLAESFRYTEKYYQPYFLRIKVITADGYVPKSILEATVLEVEAHVRNSRQSGYNAEFKRFIREDRHFCDTLDHWLRPRALQEVFHSDQRHFKIDDRRSGLAFFKLIIEQIQCPMTLAERIRISRIQIND
jgi:hypothetical protein